jgi:c-di-GMP-binding flagellar brake protein YcgR
MVAKSVSIVVAWAASASICHAENFHMYIYNECADAVRTTSQSYDFGSNKKKVLTIDVKSGNQEMVAVSDKPNFTIRSVSIDQKLNWQTIEINSSQREYTHVLSCECEGSNCPQKWPNPPSRQYSK